MDDKKALEALFNAAGGKSRKYNAGWMKALEALLNAARGNSWKYHAGWMTSTPLGEWKGVKVNGAGRVIELHLTWNNLKG